MTKISSHTDLMHLRNEKQRYLSSRLIMFNTHICIVKDYPYRMFSETFKLEKCKRTMGKKQISPKTAKNKPYYFENRFFPKGRNIKLHKTFTVCVEERERHKL